MLTSAEHEILDTPQNKKYQEIQHVSGSDKPRMLFFLLINVKMPAIVGILTFMSRKNFMLSWVKHEKGFYNLGARNCIIFNFLRMVLNTSKGQMGPFKNK